MQDTSVHTTRFRALVGATSTAALARRTGRDVSVVLESNEIRVVVASRADLEWATRTLRAFSDIDDDRLLLDMERKSHARVREPTVAVVELSI